MERIKTYIEELQATLGRMPVDAIGDVIRVLHHARMTGRQVFTMGNGGSASTASHIACDLGKGTLAPGQPRFKIIALTDNMATFSAYANDVGYDCVFAQQLTSLVQPGDVVIGISGSGNSPNVLNGIEAANQARATTIGLTGFDGGKLGKMVDINVLVPSNHMGQVEDVHMVLDHLITDCLRRAGADGPCADAPAELYGLPLVERLKAPVDKT